MSKRKISMSVGGKEIISDINNITPEEREEAKQTIRSLAGEHAGVDIFHWANQADALKDDMKIDLYVFTKNYTAYQIKHSKDLTAQIKVLFLYDLISTIETGAATGMAIRDLHTQTDHENAIDTTPLESIENAQAVIEQAQFDGNLEFFDENDHEVKKLKGIVVKFSLKGMDPFFVVKYLKQSDIVSGATSWALGAGEFRPLALGAALRMPADNQVLVIGGQIFIFNETKFTQMFAYNAKRAVMIDRKISEIEKHFRLKFPDGVTLKGLVDQSPQLAESLLRADPAAVTPDQMIEQAEEFDLALMTDDEGAIIIMDKRDATMFANLLNDDYVDSNMTGIHYLAVKKKEVPATVDSQLNMGA